ncbi:hypothetical protein CLOBOL_07262 [Enterocloster bolteae ATCC BAA-613]|uniref:Uncharacterized protein n=1 Tax=Enterocloster bolteae (strain ATCC BAA-613 / DSM 15670 / CCUG 46953 / JCM 12243 / WAL 16351) TaxID=411902 RepID=A8S5N2_ENTBW|nr:hypothetical protein CLOBOL_07262 [Enterocloster bolteae ATCC BAA-613]
MNTFLRLIIKRPIVTTIIQIYSHTSYLSANHIINHFTGINNLFIITG